MGEPEAKPPSGILEEGIQIVVVSTGAGRLEFDDIEQSNSPQPPPTLRGDEREGEYNIF